MAAERGLPAADDFIPIKEAQRRRGSLEEERRNVEDQFNKMSSELMEIMSAEAEMADVTSYQETRSGVHDFIAALDPQLSDFQKRPMS